MMIGLGTPFWNNALFSLPSHTILLESEYIPQSIKFIPILFSVLGALFAFNINIIGSSFAYMLKTSFVGRKAYIFLNKRWLFDKVYIDFVASRALAFGYHTSFKTLDKGFIEILGPTGLMQVCTNAMKQVSSLQSGFIYHYALLMLCGVSTCIAVISFWDTFSPWVDPRLYGIFVVSFIFYHQTQKA